MPKLRLLFLHEICKSSLSDHAVLGWLYQNYVRDAKPVQNPDYPYEQKEYHERLYQTILDSRQHLEAYDFHKYKDLTGLLEYIFQVQHLADALLAACRHASMHAAGCPSDDAYSFFLADARLSGFAMDLRDQKATASFTNVVVYANSGNADARGEVFTAAVKIQFEGLQSVDVQGVFDCKDPDLQYISHAYFTKEPDHYCFSILSPIGKDGCSMDIQYTKHTVHIEPASFRQDACEEDLI